MWSAGLCLAALVIAGAVQGQELRSRALGGAGKPAPAQKADSEACGSHGTSIDFVDTPVEAAKQAKEAKKLVFVLHVSGNFEDPRFT
jgi:hypothetical protein